MPAIALPTLAGQVAARTASCDGREITRLAVEWRPEGGESGTTGEAEMHIVRVETEGPGGATLFATAELTPAEIDGLSESAIATLALARAATQIAAAAAA